MMPKTKSAISTAIMAAAGLCLAPVPGAQGLESTPVYDQWLAGINDKYPNEALMGENQQVALHWKIDGDVLRFAVAVEASGWVSFGISESGGMKGADMMMFTAKDKALVDAYSVEYERPTEDTCSDNNWQYVDSKIDTEGNFMIVEAYRNLTNDDPQDMNMFDDSDMSVPSHRLIAAWGNSDMVGYHGSNAVKQNVRFFANHSSSNSNGPVTPSETMTTSDADSSTKIAFTDIEPDMIIDFRAPNYTIPVGETTYADFCYTASNLTAHGVPMTEKSHLIGVDYLPGGNEEMVHHIVIYATTTVDQGCANTYQVIWTWAPGVDEFVLPEAAGIAFGPGFYQTMRMEVHYTNVNGIPNRINQSGARIKFMGRDNLRANDAGVLSLGDPLVSLRGQRIGHDYSRWEFNCPSSCLETYAPNQGPWTVFLNFLHMHEIGARMTFRHFDSNQTVLREHSVEHYDFYASGGYSVPASPFEFNVGDSFETVCYFKEHDNNANRTFGLASDEEMCIEYLFYYPRIPTLASWCGANVDAYQPSCGGDYNYTAVTEAELNRSFGVEPQGHCPNTDLAVSGGTCNSQNAFATMLAFGAASAIAVIAG